VEETSDFSSLWSIKEACSQRELDGNGSIVEQKKATDSIEQNAERNNLANPTILTLPTNRPTNVNYLDFANDSDCQARGVERIIEAQGDEEEHGKVGKTGKP
jgi:hypothetical protein